MMVKAVLTCQDSVNPLSAQQPKSSANCLWFLLLRLLPRWREAKESWLSTSSSTGLQSPVIQEVGAIAIDR